MPANCIKFCAVFLVSTLLVVGIFATSSNAQSEPKSSGKSSGLEAKEGRNNKKGSEEKTRGRSVDGKSVEKGDNLSDVTEERESAALKFVKTHHRELSELLIYLRENDAKKYQQAIRELYRDSEKLAQVQNRNPGIYQIQLKAWINRSRIQLLVAKLRMSDTPVLREELHTELVKEKEIQIERLQAEKEVATARLKRIEESLNRIESAEKNFDRKLVEKRIDSLLGKPSKIAKPDEKKAAATHRTNK
jgi:hypothetical protein